MALSSTSMAQGSDMIRSQRSIHCFAWLLLLPALGLLIWLGATHRDMQLSNQLAPHATAEGRLP